MKIKICPKCGKQNDEDAWNCVDCGTTLSMKTLVEVDKTNLSSSTYKSKPASINLSEYFAQDFSDLQKTIRGYETVVQACNITQLTKKAPFRLGNPFRFGYLVLTSQRLIWVIFESEPRSKLKYHLYALIPGVALGILFMVTDGFVAGLAYGLLFTLALQFFPLRMAQMPPQRPYIEHFGFFAVDQITSPLSTKEKSSRKVISFDLRKIAAATLSSSGTENNSITSLIVDFADGGRAIIDFFMPNEAMEIQTALADQIESKNNSDR
jgi:hypothetical protein